MKKQELIHLHGLLGEVSNQYEEWTGESPDLGEYESLGVRPTSIHKSKTDHKAAVFAMAGGITDEMREETEERSAVAATAD
ncbi:metal-binding protein [Halobacteriales archaeon QS_8_69_26]|nr:MAG: metal-binding protein [Halobacteriales archaeon QS_8_69_26]